MPCSRCLGSQACYVSNEQRMARCLTCSHVEPKPHSDRYLAAKARKAAEKRAKSSENGTTAPDSASSSAMSISSPPPSTKDSSNAGQVDSHYYMGDYDSYDSYDSDETDESDDDSDNFVPFGNYPPEAKPPPTPPSIPNSRPPTAPTPSNVPPKQTKPLPTSNSNKPKPGYLHVSEILGLMSEVDRQYCFARLLVERNRNQNRTSSSLLSASIHVDSHSDAPYSN